MRLLLALLFALSPAAFATREVVAPHLRVLYDDPALSEYAQRAAANAERALAALAPLWGPERERVTLTLDASTDVFNAFARVLPHPGVTLRPLFPTEDELAYGARDPLYLLLLHELTHVQQLNYGALPPGEAGLPDLGLVGEDLAPPPSWFLEGVATYLESTLATGGRLQDARTRGLLQSLALSGRWPTLAEAGLVTFEDWPGGETRYLLGAAFIDHLVRHYGWDAILATLRAYNARVLTGTFAGAWRQATGTSLFEEWDAWHAEIRAAARARATNARPGRLLTHTGWSTSGPAVSPDGKHLAWVSWPPAIRLAELGKDGMLHDGRTLLAHRPPHELAWWDAGTLVYARVVPRAGSSYSELFALDVHTGRERQLTSGARAHLPAVTPDGCVLFVRDVVSEGASLRRWCRPTAAGPGSIVWRAPHGVHIVGLAVSQAGRVVLSVWRQGFVDLALLEGGRLEFLTQDAAPDLDPAWQGDERLVFRSARRADGVFQLYALGIGSGRLTQLSSTLGGAFQPVPLDGGLLYVELGPHGSNLARLARPLRRVAPIRFEALPPARAPAAAYAVRTYDPLPSLLPYGWLPTGGRFRVDPLGFGLQAAVLGQDLSGRHSYALTLGYDSSLRGLLGGAYANVRYEYGAPQLLGLLGSPAPVGFGVRLGWWPYTPHLMATTETALGLRGTLMLRLPLDRWLAQLRFGVGLVRLESFARHSPDDPWQLDGRLDAVLSNQHADDWGYRTRGLRLGLAGIWSATPAGPSPGLWGDVDLVLPLGNGALAAGLRAGYRQAPPFPVTLTSDLAATAHLAYHTSLPLGWRLGDGKLALERLSLTPRLEAWWDTRPGLGADLTLGFDSVLGYGAPVAVTATFGYAEGFWYGLGLQLP